MKKTGRAIWLAVVCMAAVNVAAADIFGSGANQFTIDFVSIPGDTNPISSIPAGDGFMFKGVANDYRMGTYEISNDQWMKFKAAYGTVTGSEPYVYKYDYAQYYPADIPTIWVSWYKAAQFVNYLNISTGHQAAYRFTGSQGTSDYTFATWSTTEAAGGTNLYRHKDAFYFLPTEDEWVKAAYWNGTSLQTYANASAGDLVSGLPDPVKWNYEPTSSNGHWNAISGVKELNGTYNMMGNVWELMESPYYPGVDYYDQTRGIRGGSVGFNGSHGYVEGAFASSFRHPVFTNSIGDPYYELGDVGFRVASVPEPASLLLLGLGGMWIRKK
jgi:formylglycine-generating enzyme required for sulfatase activity